MKNWAKEELDLLSIFILLYMCQLIRAKALNLKEFSSN